MKFKRTDLIDSLELRLKQDEARFNEQQAESKKNVELGAGHLAREQAGSYPALRTALTRAIREERALFADEIPEPIRSRNYHGGLGGAARFVPGTYTPAPAVVLALDVLRASADEFVTSSGLREAGVREIARLLPARKSK